MLGFGFPSGRSSGCRAGLRRGADGRGGVGLAEAHALRGESFQVGRLDVWTFGTRKVRMQLDRGLNPVLVVGEEEEDVWIRRTHHRWLVRREERGGEEEKGYCEVFHGRVFLPTDCSDECRC